MDTEVLGKIMAGVFITIGVIIAVAGTGLLLAFPIKWTWNTTMPYLFGWSAITWGKAWCLHFLCGCLIKATQTNNNTNK